MSDRPKIPQPSVYVPQGHVSLKEALVRAAEAIHPMENVRGFVFSNAHMAAVDFDPLREPPGDVLDPFSWPPQHPTSEFDALEEARERIRWFLAEGLLATIGQLHDGELVLISQGFWRTDAGGNALRFPARVVQYTQIFITDQALGSWLSDIPHWYDLGSPSQDSTTSTQDEEPLPDATSSGRISRLKLESWLVDQMGSNSDVVRRNKKHAFAVAQQMFGPKLTMYVFSPIWTKAIEATGRADLSKPGPKPEPKSAE